jgi:hypothetical protein
MRPTRKKLKFDEESVNNLLQEIYNESHNIKAKITRLFTKWELKVKENSEVAAIGDQIVKLIAAEAKNQDQKIMLLRYLKEVVFDNKAGNNNSQQKNDDEKNLSAERKNELLRMVEEGLERKDKESKKE